MKKLYKNKFDKSRRNFLKTVGAAGISNGLLRASPLVGGMMMSRAAEAQTGPSKSAICYVPGGALYQYWEPDANFVLPSKTAQYEDIKNECLFLRNMKRAGAGGHGSMYQLLRNTNLGGLESFDVNIGKVFNTGTKFQYLNAGVMSDLGQGGGYQISRNASGEIPYILSPFNMFKRVFGNGGSSNSNNTTTDLTLNVIDVHKEALSALQTKLGFHEKVRLDQHLTSIEETQKRLVDFGGGVGGSCDTGSAPAEFVLDSSTFTRQAHLQADILTLALKCNLTNSVSLALGNHSKEHSIPELKFQNSYHNSIHGGQGGAEYLNYQEMRAHMGGLSAYFIRRLKQEGILDDTIYFELSCMGNGDTHGNTNVPMILAGGGSAIKKGNVRAGNATYTNWDVFETMGAVLGAQQNPDYQKFSNSIVPGVIA